MNWWQDWVGIDSSGPGAAEKRTSLIDLNGNIRIIRRRINVTNDRLFDADFVRPFLLRLDLMFAFRRRWRSQRRGRSSGGGRRRRRRREGFRGLGHGQRFPHFAQKRSETLELYVKFLRDEKNFFFSVGGGPEQGADLVDDGLVASRRFRREARVFRPVGRQPTTNLRRL